MKETLICTCGEKMSGTNLQLFDAGWRLYGNQALCPACAAKVEAAHRLAAVKKYGEEAVARADRIMLK